MTSSGENGLNIKANDAQEEVASVALLDRLERVLGTSEMHLLH